MAFHVFDPVVKIDKDSGVDTSVIWSTKSIDMAKKAISRGQAIKKQPFISGTPELKKANLTFQPSDKEILEIVKCANDIVYFANNYVYLKTQFGRVLLKDVGGLRDYQVDMLKGYQNNDYTIVLSSRQIGKTVTTAIFMLWYATFNYDKTIGILGNKGATGKQILSEVKQMYKALPFFLKAGLEGWNVSSLAFDNGVKIITRATTEDSLQGLSIDCLYLDEFAYVRENLQRPFWTNVWPTISAIDNSKVIISSTPNGKNLFWELWDASIKGKNELVPIRVDWWQVPKRDEAWKAREISNIGESAFKQQYGLSFDVTLETLINELAMKYMDDNLADYVCIADHLNIDPKWDKYMFAKNDTIIDYEKDYFMFTVDIAEGLGSEYNDDPDYSTVTGYRVCYDDEMDKVYYEQCIKFKCNSIITPDFGKYTAKFFAKFTPENIRVMVEENKYGETYFYAMDNDESIEVDNFIFCKFKRSAKEKRPKRGFRRNRENKNIAVGIYKKLVEDFTIRINEPETYNEIINFQENKKGSYNAMVGHDDLVNGVVNMAYFLGSEDASHRVWIEDFKYFKNVNIKLNEETDFSNVSEEVRKFMNAV